MKWLSLACALLYSLPSVATETLLYACSQRQDYHDRHNGDATDVVAVDMTSGVEKIIYSDRGQTLLLSRSGGVIMASANGRLFARADERRGGKPAIYELTTDGSHQQRRLFAPEVSTPAR